MPSCEVQRTLVKSPPELWAELSDPASLARHLGDFGEIRTIRVEPETAVEWEAEEVRGVVQLKPSGWGTKVTLTAIRELPADEIVPNVEAERGPQAGQPVEPELEAKLQPAPETGPEAEAETEPEHGLEVEPELEPTPRPSLLARLFRRWRKEQPETESEPVMRPEPEPRAELEAEPETAAEPEPAPEDRPDLAAELAGVEAEMVAQDAALLSAVLDRLGAAHHRPFSRG